MRAFQLAFTACILLTAVSCTITPPAIAPSPTAVSQTILSTETAVPPTATIEPTVAATETAVPVPTSTPTPTSTPPPAPTGQIIYFWDPEYPLDNYGIEPYPSLYLVQFGHTPTEWTITSIISNLVGLPRAALSPDQTKLALTVLEDRNNDGVISYGSYQRGGDALNLYVYSLLDQTMERLTENYPDVINLSWSPDSQEIAFLDNDAVLSYNLRAETLQFLSENNLDKVSQVAWSPSGDQLAFKLYSGVLYFFRKETREVVQVSENQANFNSLGLMWSPDGTWLASNTTLGGGLVVVNSDRDEIVELVSTNFFCDYAWAPTGNNLAFVRWLREGGASLELARTDNFVPKILFEAERIFPPIWTSDGSIVTIGYLNDSESGLLVFNLETDESLQLFHSSAEVEIRPLVWSPDRQWLLYSQKQAEESGLYLIHRGSDQPYRLLDTTGTVMPYFVNWLPENTVAP